MNTCVHEVVKINTEAKISLHNYRLTCADCAVREVCMPLDAGLDLIDKLDALIVRKRFKTGSAIYHAGSSFHALYAVRSGFIKTETLDEDGRAQITGFFMRGELLGFDGIATDAHMCTSIALEDSEVCIIPFGRNGHVGIELEKLQRHYYKLMSREIIRDHTIMMLLGSMQGEERLAAFLLNLSHRFKERGYSPYQLVLRMKREEVGSYLGLKVETVSRILSKLQDMALIEVHQKNINILDIQGLRRLVSQHPCK